MFMFSYQSVISYQHMLLSPKVVNSTNNMYINAQVENSIVSGSLTIRELVSGSEQLHRRPATTCGPKKCVFEIDSVCMYNIQRRGTLLNTVYKSDGRFGTCPARFPCFTADGATCPILTVLLHTMEAYGFYVLGILILLQGRIQGGYRV